MTLRFHKLAEEDYTRLLEKMPQTCPPTDNNGYKKTAPDSDLWKAYMAILLKTRVLTQEQLQTYSYRGDWFNVKKDTVQGWHFDLPNPPMRHGFQSLCILSQDSNTPTEVELENKEIQEVPPGTVISSTVPFFHRRGLSTSNHIRYALEISQVFTTRH